MGNEVKSKHIFMFPFKWDKAIGEKNNSIKYSDRVDLEKLLSIFDNTNKNWTEWGEHIKKNDKAPIENYNEYTYFYNNVRDAIYGNDQAPNKRQNMVKIYHYKKEEQGKYIIGCKREKSNPHEKIEEQYECKEYCLKLTKVELKIYTTGIGILSFFVENDKYDTLDELTQINEYGRRIFPQFIDLETGETDKTKEVFLAEYLKIEYGETKIEERFNEDYRVSGNKVAQIIVGMLGKRYFSSDKDAIHSYKDQELFFAIRPLIDDRMFVVSSWINDEQSKNLASYTKNKKHKKLTSHIKDDENKYPYLTSKEWYRYIFCEPSICCENQSMLEQILEKHTYDRWSNYGTLYGVSYYSFVALANEEGRKHVEKDMMTTYYQMVCLALAQRGSILRFENELTDISIYVMGNIEKERTDMAIKAIQELYENFKFFMSGLYFREVTAQEQGIELYDLIKKVMKIEKNIETLKQDIGELFQYANLLAANKSAEEERKTTNAMNNLTYLGAALMVPTLITGICGMNIIVSNEEGMNWLKLFGWVLGWCVGIGSITLGIMKKGQNRNSGKENKKQDNGGRNLFIGVICMVIGFLVYYIVPMLG